MNIKHSQIDKFKQFENAQLGKEEQEKVQGGFFAIQYEFTDDLTAVTRIEGDYQKGFVICIPISDPSTFLF